MICWSGLLEALPKYVESYEFDRKGHLGAAADVMAPQPLDDSILPRAPARSANSIAFNVPGFSRSASAVMTGLDTRQAIRRERPKNLIYSPGTSFSRCGRWSGTHNCGGRSG
jgi:hypothetical protein